MRSLEVRKTYLSVNISLKKNSLNFYKFALKFRFLPFRVVLRGRDFFH
jgi:hypothetical protein